MADGRQDKLGMSGLVKKTFLLARPLRKQVPGGRSELGGRKQVPEKAKWPLGTNLPVLRRIPWL